MSIDDERREYMKKINYYFNTNQITKMCDYMHKHFEHESFVFRQTINYLDDNGEELFYFLPKILEIKGLDLFIKYSTTLIVCSPDITINASKIVIRNRTDRSMIIADVEFQLTPTFHLAVKNIIKSAISKSANEDDQKSRKKPKPSDSQLLNEVELTDRLLNIEKVIISENAPESPSCDFVKTRIRKPEEMVSFKVTAVVRYHLGRDRKCYLIENDISKIEKVISNEPEITFSKVTKSKYLTNENRFCPVQTVKNNMKQFLKFKNDEACELII